VSFSVLCHLLFLFAIASILAAQNHGGKPDPAPAPPPRIETKPVTPARIRVGCAVQMAYIGPSARWFNSGMESLSDEQIADLEKVVATHPEDVCARGYLIAHGQGRVSRRVDHVLWMIRNKPEWDGFLLNLSPPYDGDEPGAYDNVKAAWLQQVGPDQRSGTVLHHAAVFFESHEPEFAQALLERAIRLEPDVLLHIEGLGILYGRAQFGSDPSFATRAKTALLSSADWVVVAGALNAIRPFNKGTNGDLERLLLARLRKLVGNRTPMDVLNDLPSRSAQYHDSQCDPMPLLRRCGDSVIP
jgi:hypothetical protein